MYDPKCLELAVLFVTETWPNATALDSDGLASTLAQRIQDTVEGFCSEDWQPEIKPQEEPT